MTRAFTGFSRPARQQGQPLVSLGVVLGGCLRGRSPGPLHLGEARFAKPLDDSRNGLAPFRNGLGGPLVQPISRAPGEGGGLERGASSSSFVDDPEDQGLLV